VSAKITKEIKQAEVIFYSEHIVYSDIPTPDIDEKEYNLRIEQKISRILKYYPGIVLDKVEVCTVCYTSSYVSENETVPRIGTISENKTMYKNQAIQVHMQFNSFSHTVYINLI
jgi:hypothetical protein